VGVRRSMKRGDEESEAGREVIVDTNRGGCFFPLVFRVCFRFRSAVLYLVFLLSLSDGEWCSMIPYEFRI